MKKLIALFTVALSTSIMASTPIDRGVVTDTYKTVIKQIPYRVEVCQDRVQPAGDGSATNELVGALFGGAIGNSFGKGDGKDAMTQESCPNKLNDCPDWFLNGIKKKIFRRFSWIGQGKKTRFKRNI